MQAVWFLHGKLHKQDEFSWFDVNGKIHHHSGGLLQQVFSFGVTGIVIKQASLFLRVTCQSSQGTAVSWLAVV